MSDPSRGDRSTIAVLSIQAVVVTVNGVAARGRSLPKVKIIQSVCRCDCCRLRLEKNSNYLAFMLMFLYVPSSAGLADDGAAEVASGLPGSHGMESDINNTPRHGASGV